MKKALSKISIILFVIFLSVTFNFPYFSSYSLAENNKYLRVTDSNVGFYSDINCTDFLFFLPYTYYVKQLAEYDGCYFVECYGDGAPLLDGYVKKENLFYDGLEVSSPYLNLTLTTTISAAFYSDSDITRIEQFVFKNKTLNYYGYVVSPQNTYAYFVSYNGKLGYVLEDSVKPFSVANHPNPLTFLDIEKEPEKEEVKQEKDKYISLKIAIILFLIFAGVVALVACFHPKKKAENLACYFDEEEN